MYIIIYFYKRRCYCTAKYYYNRYNINIKQYNKYERKQYGDDALFIHYSNRQHNLLMTK